MSSSPPPASPLPVFSSLPQRPPTPPKDKNVTDVDDALRFLEDGHQSPTKTTRERRPERVAGTPPSHSPATSQQGSGTGKRVDFSPWPIYHNPPQLGQNSTFRPAMVKQIPYSRSTKPLKSILKSVIDFSPLTPDDIEKQLGYFSPEKPESFEKMLQSVLQQLASPNRTSRLDAYLALNGSLKAFEGMPNPQAIVERISLLTQFLSRDMQWKDSKGALDGNIVIQALHLTSAILFNAQTSQALDDDFRAFLIDRSISVLDQTGISKGIIKTHLYLLTHQRVYSGVLTAGRIDKILSAIKTLEERCSGNSAIAARLIIYQRLIEQAAIVMLHKMGDWMENVLHGMLSSNKDIRVRAIDACSKAGYVLGTNMQASATLTSILEAEIEDAVTFGDFFNNRLIEMISDQEVGADVPRIWASIVLLVRCKRAPIHRWSKFREWLVTIQRCFNSSDLAIKQQASLAWNKLIFAVMPDNTTTEVCRSMLKVPITASLEKPGSDKQHPQIRQFALNSYYNLLHYALRPGLSHPELDMAWDMYVQPVVMAIHKSSAKGPEQACRILSGLFNKSNGSWNINAVMETEAIKPEDLPRLDTRWVRSRIRRVITLFEPILDSALRSNTATPFFSDAWTLLWQAVAEAGSQEIRTSNELKDALAQIINLFARVWRNGLKLSFKVDTASWFQKFHDFLKTTVETLGSGPFVEDVLSKTTDDEVEATPTPSNRPSKGHSNTHSPLVFLFSLYYQPPPGIEANETYSNCASWLMDFLTAAKVSAVERLQILTQVIQHCPQLHASNVPVDISQQLWAVAARKAIEFLPTLRMAPSHETQSTGIAIRYALSIMTKGLQLAALNEDNLEVILDLFAAMCDAAYQCDGEGAVLLAVIEPISAVLVNGLDTIRNAILQQLATRLLQRATWPKGRHILDYARKALYTSLPEPARTPAFEPFKHLPGLIAQVSQQIYQRDHPDSVHELPMAFLQSLVTFLRGWPLSPGNRGLEQLQTGLTVWIQDFDRRILPLPEAWNAIAADSSLRQIASTNSRQMTSLWSDIMDTIRKVSRHDSPLLQSIDILLISGLSSPSRDIVNATIVLWDDTFGSQVALEYPARLLPVLRARHEQTVMSLPGLPPRAEGEPIVSLPSFYDPETETYSPPKSSMLKSRTQGSLVRRVSPKKNKSPHSARKTKQTGNGSKAKARLRHDDSQIDFEPIASELLLSNNSSQLLTDHQKDVRDEQQANAHMFPDLSSSPIQSSTTPTRHLPKTLDFSAPGHMQDPMETPNGPADGNIMSDDLPSSPTPRATSRAAVVQAPDLEMDIPSSPPKSPDVQTRGPEVLEFAHVGTPSKVNEGDQEQSIDALVLPPPDVSPANVSSQPQHQALTSNTNNLDKPPFDAVVSEELNRDDNLLGSQVDVSAIDDPSFCSDASQLADRSKEDTNTGSRHSRRRKRRQASGPKLTVRKHSKQSASNVEAVTSAPDPPQLDDADDEIVVLPREGSSLNTQSLSEDIQEAPSLEKRKRGKKRKLDAVQASQSSPAAKERHERDASGVTDTTSSKRSGSVAIDSRPTSPKLLKRHRDQDVKTANSEQNQNQTRRGSKRRLAAVVIPDGKPEHNDASAKESHERAEVETDGGSAYSSDAVNPDSQLTEEHSRAVHGRPIAQPHSIIARLRGVLSDCKKMIFGSQEERELDDVLFELRREVHEASRRGRDV